MMNKPIFWILILSFLIRALVAIQPAEALISRTLQDDSYYYFSTARNIATGIGVTEDGINPTNSFHVIWQTIMVPFFWLGGGMDTPIHFILIVSAIIDTLTIGLLYKLAVRISNINIANLSAAIYGINPFVIMANISGMEGALMTLSVLMVIYYFVLCKDKFSIKNMLVLGLLSYIAIFSRWDAVILIFLISIYLIHKNFKRGILFSAIVFFLISPWFVWSYSGFGTILPNSGKVVYEFYHGLGQPEHVQTLGEVSSIIMRNTIKFFGTIFHQLGAVSQFPIYVNAFIVFFVLLTIVYSTDLMKKLNIFFLFAVGIFLFYSVYMWAIHIRYFTPLIPILCILISGGALKISEKIKINSKILPAAFIIVLISGGLIQWNEKYFPWQTVMYKWTEWINNITDKSDVLASFNSGIITYYTERKTLNLDGLVNPYGLDFLKNRSVINYMKSKNVSYFIDGSFYNESVYRNYAEYGYEVDPLFDSYQSSFLGEGKEDMILLKKEYGIYAHVSGEKFSVMFFAYRLNSSQISSYPISPII